uniref:Uncharacterized protein n=1 Tax=viral metagenome TaxID=1070528 RepID=A0A6C0EI82_9ZZZZ
MHENIALFEKIINSLNLKVIIINSINNEIRLDKLNNIL